MVLVLDTYFRLVGARIAPDAPEVVRLRHLLRSLAIHPEELRSDPSFRSVEGLAGRVRVFQRLDRGQSNGIPNTYREVWDEFRGGRRGATG